MKLFLYLTFFLASIQQSVFARVGGSGTGGGKGVVCTQANGEFTVELLDLWEERNLRKNQIVTSTGNLKADLDSALLRTKSIFTEEDIQKTDGSFLKTDEETLEELQFVSYGIAGLKNFNNVQRLTGKKLPLTDDSFEGNLDLGPNCHIEQLVVFTHGSGITSRWQIDMDLVSKMDSVNLAALSLHEALYGLFDTYSFETNSLRVRRAVGYVMSGKSFASIQSLLQTPYVKCATNTIAEEMGVPKDDPRYSYLNRILTGFVYFVQNRGVSYPRISMIVDKIRTSRLIGFNSPILTAQGIDLNLTVHEFYQKLTTSNSDIVARGNSHDVEHETEVVFQMRAGLGTVSKPKSTGGGFTPAPVGNLNCTLIQ